MIVLINVWQITILLTKQFLYFLLSRLSKSSNVEVAAKQSSRSLSIRLDFEYQLLQSWVFEEKTHNVKFALIRQIPCTNKEPLQSGSLSVLLADAEIAYFTIVENQMTFLLLLHHNSHNSRSILNDLRNWFNGKKIFYGKM